MQLDHIFVFIEPDGPEIELLKGLGLRETYRREHPGQGTANVCFAFENAFLELLWITNPADAASAAIARTGLLARSKWRTEGTCPLGIAWRGGGEAIPTWPFHPPYLPKGVSIPVAIDGDDPHQPMMFTFPGTVAPTDWAAERHGGFQRGGGFSLIEKIELCLPSQIMPSTSLQAISNQMTPPLLVTSGPTFSLKLKLSRLDGSSVTISLPKCGFVDAA